MMLQAGLQNKKHEIFDILTMVERPVQFSAGRFACTHILLLRTDCNYTKIELLGKCKNIEQNLLL